MLVVACSHGGGAYAGYDLKRGPVAGVEGGVGVGDLQTNIGLDLLGHVFARFDLASPGTDPKSAGVSVATRLGVGLVGSIVDPGVEHHVTGLFGLGAQDVYRYSTPSGQDPVCSNDSTMATFELQLRYTDAVEIVFSGRADASSSRCVY